MTPKLRGMPVEAPFGQQIQHHVLRDEWDRVISLCQLVISQDDSQIDCWALMAKAFVHQGEDEAAIATYDKGLEQQPNQPESHYALGILYARQKKYSRAIGHYQTAHRLKPDWSQAAFKLGELFHRLGRSNQALKAYQAAIESDSTHVEAQLALGFLQEQRGEYGLAIKHYRQSTFLQPENPKAYRYLGEALTRVNAYAAAAQVYTQALERSPDDAMLHNNLAQVSVMVEDIQSAMAAYHRALELDSDLAITVQNLGRLWRSYQDLDKAAGYFHRACKLAPDSASALSDYAAVLIDQGRWADLFDCFRQALALQPGWIAAYCRRTVQLSDEDLLFRVQRTCARFLMGLQQPESAATASILQDRLAQVYEYLGDLSTACDAPDRAEQSYRLALALTPREIRLYGRLGDCLIKQGRRPAAIAIYQAGILQNAAKSVPDQLENQLKKQLQQALCGSSSTVKSTVKSDSLGAEPAEVSEFEIKGIYRTAQDWQTAHSKSATDVIDLNSLQEPDSSNCALSCPLLAAKSKPDPQCGGVTCQLCMAGLMRHFSPVQVGKRAFRCTFQRSAAQVPVTPVPPFSTFAVAIPQGRAWVAPQKNDWDVCNEVAIFTPDNALVGDLSRCYPWYLPGCVRHDVTSHSVLHRFSPLPPPQRIAGTVAMLSGLSGHIYYHWLFDVLPRIKILQQHLHRQQLTLAAVDFFVVNNFEKAFQKETLAALKIPLEKVVASDRVPHLQADNLLVPSFPGHLDWVPPSTIDFLRRVFLFGQSTAENSGDNSGSAPGKRFYITRSQAKYRHIFNEAAVIDLLSAFGFTVVALESLTVAQQVRLFADAEAIVAAHGSGLANLAFCSPGATIIECFSPHYLRTDYWMISQYLKLKHYYLVGEGFACQPLRQIMYPSGLTEDFSIDVVELRSLLKTAGIEPP